MCPNDKKGHTIYFEKDNHNLLAWHPRTFKIYFTSKFTGFQIVENGERKREREESVQYILRDYLFAM